ncbi:MAG: NADH-quinone oxidoreductase subunit C [Mangrovibacterium sp.]
MKNAELQLSLQERFPEASFPENTQLTEMVVPAGQIHVVAEHLINAGFDYLISLTAVDWKDKMMMVYHLESVKSRQLLLVKADITDRDKPIIDSVSDIWPTAIPHECEVFDLFGIRFANHPALRRLFLEDAYGFPLRKDFRDEVNIIER